MLSLFLMVFFQNHLLLRFHDEMITIVCPKVKTMELKETAMKRLIFVVIILLTSFIGLAQEKKAYQLFDKKGKKVSYAKF